MAYFTQAFNTFFLELAEHNSSEWFADHKAVYEKEVKKPFLQFISDLIVKCGHDDPSFQQLAKDAIFRINRDIRFSTDKRPYKEQVSAIVSKYGKKTVLPGFYLQLSPSDTWLGGGAYELDKEALAKIRSEIHYNGAEFHAILEEPAFVKFYGGKLLGDTNKILPEPYKEAVKTEPYLANKQFYYMATYSGQETILRDDLLEFAFEHYLASKPINQFLATAINTSIS